VAANIRWDREKKSEIDPPGLPDDAY